MQALLTRKRFGCWASATSVEGSPFASLRAALKETFETVATSFKSQSLILQAS